MTDFEKDGTGESAGDSGTSAPGSPSDSATERRSGRRRFLVGGLAAAPVIMTLSSRPAAATTCSMLSGGSLNTSTPGDDTSCYGYGCSHWMAYKDYWKYQFPTYKKTSWMVGCYVPGGDPNIWDALSAGGLHGQCVAGVLNGWAIPTQYGYSQTEIKNKINEYVNDGRSSDLYAMFLQMNIG